MLKTGIVLALSAVCCLTQNSIDWPNRCIPDGELCQNHSDCCSATCLAYSSKCAIDPSYYHESSLDQGALQVLVNNLFASTDRPANYSSPPTNLGERFGEDSTSSSTTQSAIPLDENTTLGDCKVIGMKCYRDSECCTKRCHGFLHQCVT